MEETSILGLIQQLIKRDFSLLPTYDQEWLKAHLILPHPIKLSDDLDGHAYSEYWLVTDHIGKDDSSYRIVFDPIIAEFGLECTLQSGIEWYMGCYGSFSKTITNM